MREVAKLIGASSGQESRINFYAFSGDEFAPVADAFPLILHEQGGYVTTEYCDEAKGIAIFCGFLRKLT